MHLARTLLVLVAMAVPTLALSATALAQVQVFNEETDGLCSNVTLDGHDVEGGCHVEYRSEEHTPLVVYTPSPVVVFNCDWHFEAQIGGDGSGYVTDATMTTEPEGTDPPCAREPCDEATHEMLPWPVRMTRTSVDITVCLRLATAGEGGSGAQCQLHLQFTHAPGHDHEIGDHSEDFCEEYLAVAFQDVHFVPEVAPGEGTEDIYIPEPTSIAVHDEASETPCQSISLAGHAVEGGCHLELKSEHHITTVLQTPSGPIPLFYCNWHLEGRLDQNGRGFVTAASLTSEPLGSPCLRTACDEANGTMLPWPITITEVGGLEMVETTFCLRTISSGPGGAGTYCQVHLPLSDNSGHNYELGDNTVHTCEDLPAVSFQNVHFVNEVPAGGDGEDMEIVH